MWETQGEVFLSKYVMLDPSFDNLLGCMRHELAHALVGPEENHGPVCHFGANYLKVVLVRPCGSVWIAAVRRIECPAG